MQKSTTYHCRNDFVTFPFCHANQKAQSTEHKQLLKLNGTEYDKKFCDMIKFS